MHHSSEPVIVLRNVIKRFGSTTAVNNVTFTVAAGETVSLLGPSGCGKTTTLRLVSGFDDPDAGVIEIAGESMVGKRPYERNVGLLFQHYALFPHMTVAENVGYGLKHRHWPKDEIGDRIGEMLRLVRLQGFESRRPGQLSGGQQQRVALARVLATKPKLVLLDEPLSALDAKLRQELGTELKQILTTVGSTTIVVTHDQEEAMSLADRIIVMNRGRIEQMGAPDEIYMRPRTAFVAGFIGRTNWFHGHMTGRASDGLWRLVTKAGTALLVKNPGLAPSTNWRVCVRPERIVVKCRQLKSGKRGENLLSGEITDVVNMGAGFHYISETAEGRVIAVESNRDGARVKKGDKVSLLIRADDCVLLSPDVD
jgi:ABC-type Fe3+/spermidine/putrescine transport system ATPase subunit